MGISGSTKAPLYALFGTMRFGATRFGYTSPKVFVKVGGVQRANGGTDILQSLSITETNNSTPNKASFNAMQTWEPSNGMAVEVTLGSINRIRKLFAGTVLNVTETNSGVLRKFAVDCVDWSWKLDNSPAVYGYYTGTYDAIARELMSDYGPTDFTVRQVETDLPTCTGGITFTGVKLSKALDRLQKRARGEGITITKFIDYNKDLYFRQTQSRDWTSPQNVTVSLDTFKRVAKRSDLSQIANRVPFIGGGANALAEVAAGETILPMTDVPDYWYGDVGGVVVSGPQQITYTARVVGGGGSVVGPGVAPSNAPTAALASGSGVDSGSHVIAFIWRTATGPTIAGATTTIVVGLVSAPVAAVAAGTPSSGGSMDAGQHRYYPVFRTASGSTTAGPASNSVTAATADADPASISGTSGSKAGGSLNFVTTSYRWKFSYRRVADSAETLTTAGVIDIVANPSDGTATLNLTFYGIAAPSGYALAWYRSEDAGATYKAVSSFSYETDGLGNLRFVDGSSSGSLGAAPPVTNNTAKGTCSVTGIPVSSSALVTFVDMYREFNSAGASTAKLAFSVTNGTTSGSDTLANASLGATVPSTNTAAANQIAVSGISVGPTGTTSREVYMSPAGGGSRKLALTIANNTATTGTITISDATLASQAAEPTSDTSGLAQPSGQILPGSTSVVVAGTAPFQSGGGWAFSGTQQFRYAGFTGASLTGVPASGAGSITQPINYNTTIAAAPCLTGIPSSGDGSILYTIPKGDPVNLYVVVEDTDAQADLAARLDDGSDGVRECSPLSDNRLKRTEAITRASAFLALRAYQSVGLNPLVSKDVNVRAGLSLNVSVAAPHNINDAFTIQSVTINNFSQALPPDYTFQASDELVTVEDLMSRDS